MVQVSESVVSKREGVADQQSDDTPSVYMSLQKELEKRRLFFASSSSGLSTTEETEQQLCHNEYGEEDFT